VFHDDFLKANLLNFCLRFNHAGNVNLALLIGRHCSVKGKTLIQSVIAQHHFLNIFVTTKKTVIYNFVRLFFHSSK